MSEPLTQDAALSETILKRAAAPPKTLVVYMSQTGNTRKVAEAIYGALPEPKEMKRLQDVKSLEGYGLAFLGFPVQGSGPNGQARSALGRLTKGRKVALFITHAAPEDAPEMPECRQRFRDAAEGANVVGLFDCQGQLAWMVKTMMRFMPDPQLRKWAKMDNSNGQPDTARLEQARAFARQIVNGHT